MPNSRRKTGSLPRTGNRRPAEKIRSFPGRIISSSVLSVMRGRIYCQSVRPLVMLPLPHSTSGDTTAAVSLLRVIYQPHDHRAAGFPAA